LEERIGREHIRQATGRDPRSRRVHALSSSTRARRGVTLIETLITVAIIALVSGMAVLGVGATARARLKRAATQIAGSVRIAYAHSISTSKSVRLAFDFETGKTTLEESPQRHLIVRDPSGGASPATELEAQAQAANQAIQGPHLAKSEFSAGKAFGFPDEGRELPSGIGFWSVQTSHQDTPTGEGRGYLYFFPNGQTETAAIQIRISNSDEGEDSNYVTVLVAPLTGRTEVRRGRVDMPQPRDDREASEREDTGR
jgi:general secretion pathway protein H